MWWFRALLFGKADGMPDCTGMPGHDYRYPEDKRHQRQLARYVLAG